MTFEIQINDPLPRPIWARGGEPVLGVRDLTKRYGKNIALAPVSLDFHPGQVHVLFGENGAGKSTLISMLAGANTPSGGTIETEGLSGRFHSVGDARKHGVRAVFQEFSLIPHQTVAENIILGEEPVKAFGMLDKGAAMQEAEKLIADLGFELDARAKVISLTRGKQQMVEICKALRRPPKLLILDEPTASLSEHDAQALLKLVLRLKAQAQRSSTSPTGCTRFRWWATASPSCATASSSIPCLPTQTRKS